VKVVIPGRQLRAAVKEAVAIAQPNDDRQILRNLLFAATKNAVEITATDTIVGMWLRIPTDVNVEVKKEGRAVVNAKNMQRLADTLANKDITLSATKRSLNVTTDKARHRLVVEDANDFPKIARFSKRKPYITLPAASVVKMISRTDFCAHDEASFFLMHGLLVTAKKREMRMVATNGQRLGVAFTKFGDREGKLSDQADEEAITTCPSCESGKEPFLLKLLSEEERICCEDCRPAEDSHEEFDQELVIPAYLAGAVKRIVNSEVDTIDVQWMANFLNFRTKLGEVSIRGLSGNYPAYKRGIPSATRPMVLNRRDFIDILKQTVALKSPTTNFVDLDFQPSRMVFSSRVDGQGESVIEHEAEWTHEPIKITINPDFMLETLTSVRGDQVVLEVGDEMTPTILREYESPEDLESFCVYAVVRQ